jgi:hypothetical protein
MPRLTAIFCCLLFTAGLSADPGRVIRGAKRVEGEYLITFHHAIPAAAASKVLAAHGAQIIAEFPDIHTFWVRTADDTALRLTFDGAVRAVEENMTLELAVSNPQTGVTSAPPVSGSGASMWGLDRIDQLSPPAARLNDLYQWCADGSGVRIYIVDTGVYAGHSQFGGRVDSLPELASYLTALGIGLGDQCWTQSRFDADASHGTAVASIAAGETLGVAKGATVVDARAMNCRGVGDVARFTYVLDWIDRMDPRRNVPSVINMSIAGVATGSNAEYVLASQITICVDTYNIPVVTAAGNFNIDANNVYPGNAPRAITVGALARNSDTYWYRDSTHASNYGSKIDFWAPGQYVEAASTRLLVFLPTETHDYYRSDLPECAGLGDLCTTGTSFAAPHTSGIIARYLQRHPYATRNTIVTALQNTSFTYANVNVTDQGGVTRPVLVYNECP